MSTTLAIMLVCLAIGLVVALVGVVQLGRSVYRMYKLIVALQAELQAQVALLVSKQDDILARLDSIQENQTELAENLERLQAAFGRLGFIVSEWSESAAIVKPYSPLEGIQGAWGAAAGILRAVR
jgi:uncharacterized protein YoxC